MALLMAKSQLAQKMGMFFKLGLKKILENF
jgi:hypothetical protein